MFQGKGRVAFFSFRKGVGKNRNMGLTLKGKGLQRKKEEYKGQTRLWKNNKKGCPSGLQAMQDKTLPRWGGVFYLHPGKKFG